MRQTGLKPETRRPHALFIAYAFPPISRSGTHRTLAFVRHLDRLGWNATVLTVSPFGEPMDASLLDEVPNSTRIIRVPYVDLVDRLKAFAGRFLGGARVGSRSSSAKGESGRSSTRGLRDWLSRLLQTPDSRIGWIAPGVCEALRAVAHCRPDVLYSTSPCMSAHLIALLVSRWNHIPWVADFRDPWCDNPFRDLGYAALRAWDSAFEWMVLRSASRVICNTPTMARSLRRRRPFVSSKCVTIMNGFDRERLRGMLRIRQDADSAFVMTHCGQFYGPRSPIVWFAAVRRVLDASPELRGAFQFVLVGPDDYDGRPLSAWADRAGVRDAVRVLGMRPHREALGLLAGSDAAILAGSDGPGTELQVPGKLFEYLMLRRPIIATGPASSPVRAILREARADARMYAPDDVAGLASAITHLARNQSFGVAGAWEGVDAFDRAHRARELDFVLRQAARLPHPEQTGLIWNSDQGGVLSAGGDRALVPTIVRRISGFARAEVRGSLANQRRGTNYSP